MTRELSSRLENLLSIVRRVMKSREIGVSGRLAEVKIRYTGFETHTHGRSIPVSMNDDEVFTSSPSGYLLTMFNQVKRSD